MTSAFLGVLVALADFFTKVLKQSFLPTMRLVLPLKSACYLEFEARASSSARSASLS
jgi:hypothetical protein